MRYKPYRFEAFVQGNRTDENIGEPRFRDDKLDVIMEELAVLKAHICPITEQADGTHLHQTNTNLTEAIKIKNELDQIYEAIAKTKQEIASLSGVGIKMTSNRPMDELDAVVCGTEDATNQILSAVEEVEANATFLANSLAGEEGLVAANIQEKVLSIYEACNFQDITGQRISKVVDALRFVSERTEKMIEIWGGMESFAHMEGVAMDDAKGDDSLKNGPPLEGDDDVASQDDIDALFA